MHRVWFLFLVGLEYNITQPCKRRWYHVIFCNKCSFVLKSLDFFENLFQLFMWKNCWKFRSITNFYYIPLLFVCWPLDYLFKTYCWRKEGAFHGKTTQQGSKKKGRSYHHFCAYSKCCTFEFWTKNYFSQRFLIPLAKQIYGILSMPCKAVQKTTSRKIIKWFFFWW